MDRFSGGNERLKDRLSRLLNKRLRTLEIARELAEPHMEGIDLELEVDQVSTSTANQSRVMEAGSMATQASELDQIAQKVEAVFEEIFSKNPDLHAELKERINGSSAETLIDI